MRPGLQVDCGTSAIAEEPRSGQYARTQGLLLVGMKVALAVVAELWAAGSNAAWAGIDFAAMPVGCSWSISTSYDVVLTETYLEKIDEGYRTTVEDDDLKLVLHHNTYDLNGRLVRADWENGDWDVFQPHSCSGVEGPCRVHYTNSLGNDLTEETLAVPEGDGFSVKTRSGSGSINVTYFESGQFGLVIEANGPFGWKLIEMKNCETGS